MNNPAPSSNQSVSPEQREQRIKELRAKRKARLRKIAIRSGIGMAILAVLLMAALYWLLMTFGGRDFLLAQVTARLPAGASFTWDRAEGPASGPLTLYNMRFAYEGTDFQAKRVTIDPDIRPLFGKLLRLDTLDIEGATLALPKSKDEPFELPRWPDVLPQIEPPLGLQADNFVINGFTVTQDGNHLIAISKANGGLDIRSGKAHVERIVVESDRGIFTAHGDYIPADNYTMNLTAIAVLPAKTGQTRPRFGLAAFGDLDKMDIAVAGNAPEAVKAQLTLRDEDNPNWTLVANSKGLDIARLTDPAAAAGAPLLFNLDANGVGGKARLQGTVQQGDFAVTLQPSNVSLENQVINVNPLVVDIFGGQISAIGHGDFTTPEDATFKLAVDAKQLQFAGGKDENGVDSPAIMANAKVDVAGKTQAWTVVGTGDVERDGQTATLKIDGVGNAESLQFKTLQAAMPTGKLDATGRVQWAPALAWKADAKLSGFDPGYFAPDWKGAIQGDIKTEGSTRTDGGLDLTVDASNLGGNLRGRKLSGHAAMQMQGGATDKDIDRFKGDVALGLGQSRINAKGSLTDTIDVDAKLSPLQLADLLPGASGVLRGDVVLKGQRSAPDLRADLVGSGLQYGDYKAQSLSIKGHLPWRKGRGQPAVQARDLVAGVAITALDADLSGAVENLSVQANANGEIGMLNLAGNLRKNANTWQGTIGQLNLAPSQGPRWALQQPAQFAYAPNRMTLSSSCFASSGGGTLCATADWPRQGITVTGKQFPLTLAQPYLPKREDGRPWVLRGEINLDGQFKPAGNAIQGHLNVTSATGGVRFSERARRDVISYDNLALNAQFTPSQITATLTSKLNGDGTIDARLNTGWDNYSPLSGNIAINTDQLTWMELFSEDIVEPTGKLNGNIQLAGTRSAPTIGGQAQLTNFATEIPSLGIFLQKGNVALNALADGTAQIKGAVNSGEGTLNIDGSLGWQDANAPLQLKLTGQNVLVSETRDLKATANPDITVSYAANQPLTVTGTVTIPSAMMDLERLDRGVSTSSDVVVLDPVDPQSTGAASPLKLDLTLAMGDDVQLKGFGLTGTLGGSLRVIANPGREMAAVGNLNVEGRYEAYGQKLSITRGNMTWSNSPVSDPILDLRAERKIESDNVTAGIDVTGRVSSMEARVWTDPASDESNALAYLALGRPISNLSSEEGQSIDAASAALSAGGGLLASQIGSRIGLDEAGISESRALGGSVLGIGKQLSPKLYVGFGVSLLGTGQVLTLKYLLRKGFDLEIESSSFENRGSINYRHEK